MAGWAWLKNRLWLIRFLVFLVVVLAVGWQFHRILNSDALAQGHPGVSPFIILLDFAKGMGWIRSGLTIGFYVIGIGCSYSFWHICVRNLGNQMSLRHGAMAFYYSQWGKYAPGKGLALLMRVGGAVKAGATIPIAAVAALFEVLVTMVSGALLGLLLGIGFLCSAPIGNSGTLLFHAAIILGVVLFPVLPPIFNQLVYRLAKRFINPKQQAVKPGWSDLGNGILITCGTWIFLGSSLWVLISGIGDNGLTGVSGCLRCVMFVCLASVGGFIASTPGGLGVREFLLQQYLEPFLGPKAVVVVLLLRLLWTAAEVIAVGILWIVSRRNCKMKVSTAMG